jgi:hypothetical protein
MAGQISGLISEEKSCKEIVEEIVFEAKNIILTRGRLWER